MSNLPTLLPQNQITLLSNKQGKNRAELKLNQLEANNDYAAVLEWLAEYNHTPNTYKAYLKEAKRLLLWCTYQKDKTLSDLTKGDFAEYYEFLLNPQPREFWCGPKSEKPFAGPLSPTSQKVSITIINSLLNYLVDAGYLLSNPARLIKKYQTKAFQDDRKFKVMERILEDDEWDAIKKALASMPYETAREEHKKRTVTFVICFLYLTGLRIHELANLTWSSIRYHRSKWWLFVIGKGGKEGMVPVNDELIEHIKIYRAYKKLPTLPQTDENFELVTSRDGTAIKERQIYNLVKEVGLLAAEFVKNPQSKERLEKFSPHWLRHLSASHQDRAGIKLQHIKDNHRHESSNTTRQYIHSEEQVRHEELQKLGAGVNVPGVLMEEKVKKVKMRFEIVPKNKFTSDVESVIEAIESKGKSQGFEVVRLGKGQIEVLVDNCDGNEQLFSEMVGFEAGLRGCNVDKI